METREWHPTIRQILHATLKIALDALVMPFSRKKTIRYKSAGQNIRGTIYYPEFDSRAPAILLLPTALGLTPHEHALASRLAREGYTTLVIAYSKRTTGAILKDENRRKQLEQIVVDGLYVLQANPMADENRIAVIGLSLGGYFATHVATLAKESAIKAVVVYYGIFDISLSVVASLHTPILVLQGERDDTDFVTNAKKAQELAYQYNKAYEIVLYPSSGHQFDLFEPSSVATRDAWDQTVAFLRQHMRSLSPDKDNL